MNLNGEDTHPLIKFLKKNDNDLYDFDMLGGNSLPTDFGIFVHKKSGKTLYYPEKKWDKFVELHLS